jgi:hypothetical protein
MFPFAFVPNASDQQQQQPGSLDYFQVPNNVQPLEHPPFMVTPSRYIWIPAAEHIIGELAYNWCRDPWGGLWFHVVVPTVSCMSVDARV